ncbi:unnamed protein product, partial [Ascophyllum nodosum]
AYAPKSSFAACFVDLLDNIMNDDDGFMAETGIFSSSAHKKSWSLRRGGPSPSRRSRTLGSRGNHAFVRPKMATRPITDSGVVLSRGDDRFTPSAPKLSRQGKRSPPPLGLHQSAFARAPELPLTSRASKNFALRPHTVHQVGRPPCVDSFTAAGSDVTALEIQRTQWLEEGCDKARVFEGMSDEAAGPETNDGDPREDKDGGGAAEGQDGARWSTSCAPKPMIAWGEAIIEPLATVSKTPQAKTHTKDAKHRAKEMIRKSKKRMARANRVRAELIKEEHRRAEELLYRHDNRKRAMIAAAAIEACQRGLLSAIIVV